MEGQGNSSDGNNFNRSTSTRTASNDSSNSIRTQNPIPLQDLLARLEEQNRERNDSNQDVDTTLRLTPPGRQDSLEISGGTARYVLEENEVGSSSGRHLSIKRKAPESTGSAEQTGSSQGAVRNLNMSGQLVAGRTLAGQGEQSQRNTHLRIAHQQPSYVSSLLVGNPYVSPTCQPHAAFPLSHLTHQQLIDVFNWLARNPIVSPPRQPHAAFQFNPFPHTNTTAAHPTFPMQSPINVRGTTNSENLNSFSSQSSFSSHVHQPLPSTKSVRCGIRGGGRARLSPQPSSGSIIRNDRQVAAVSESALQSSNKPRTGSMIKTDGQAAGCSESALQFSNEPRIGSTIRTDGQAAGHSKSALQSSNEPRTGSVIRTDGQTAACSESALQSSNEPRRGSMIRTDGQATGRSASSSQPSTAAEHRIAQEAVASDNADLLDSGSS